MAVYYNEFDPFAAAWLRELIKDGLIADGEVDERSIEDVLPDELRGFTQCHFFAGIGVWSLALRQAGWADDRPIWTGSCPCQPFSAAGKGGGFADERHLWPHFHYLIEQSRPSVVVGEQVASKDGLGWIDLVQADLEGTGYTSAAVDICAAGFGAPHIRQRLYWLGIKGGLEKPKSCGGDGALQPVQREKISRTLDAGRVGRLSATNGYWRDADWLRCTDEKWRPVEPGTFPLADAGAIRNRVGILRGAGNAVTLGQAQGFIEAVMDVVE